MCRKQGLIVEYLLIPSTSTCWLISRVAFCHVREYKGSRSSSGYRNLQFNNRDKKSIPIAVKPRSQNVV